MLTQQSVESRVSYCISSICESSETCTILRLGANPCKLRRLASCHVLDTSAVDRKKHILQILARKHGLREYCFSSSGAMHHSSV